MPQKLVTKNLDAAFRAISGRVRDPRAYGWVKRKKPKPLMRRDMIKPGGTSFWAKGGLVDEKLRSSELLQAMHEDTDRMLESQRMPGQKDFTNTEKRTGKGIMSGEFIKRVLKLNRNLVCEDSLGWKGGAAFYWLKTNPKMGEREKKYTSACFLHGLIPEFTIVKEDAAGLVHSGDITYGWRTVLQRLIAQRALTYAKVREEFGEVEHSDLRGQNWDTAVRPFKQ